ncbi:uncharacterized protein LOC125315475 [Rhodamnia argentea]|uniref:Uncharacterized protein LOC125315475 n=1 Tax=Rhodamnia argentea TaxID=178133 RepID=A0ABM3HJ12_9MYRT|nr:uncharacterized protein LOC125315475 [Rhodamnia argentea]
MADLAATPTAAENSPAPPSPVLQHPWPNRYKPIIGHCIVFTIPTFLGFLMVIFLAIPALMPPVFGLDPGSSLSSLNISTSHVTARWNIVLSVKNPSKLIAVEYADMKLLLSFGGELSLSRPSRIPAFDQGPRSSTTVRAEALSTLPIVNDLGMKGLVNSLKGGEVSINVVAKAKRRLHLGPCLVPVFDVYFSCMGVTFTAPNSREGGGDWMILGGTLHCEPDIFTLL